MLGWREVCDFEPVLACVFHARVYMKHLAPYCRSPSCQSAESFLKKLPILPLHEQNLSMMACCDLAVYSPIHVCIHVGQYIA